MSKLSAVPPQIHSTAYADAISRADAVVWLKTPVTEAAIFEWLHKSDIRYVLWTNGNISITAAPAFPLSPRLNSMAIEGDVVFIGKNVEVG